MSKKASVKPKTPIFYKLFKIICSVLILSIIIIASVFIYYKIQQVKLKKAQTTLIPGVIKKILNNPDTKIESIENVQDLGGVYQFILVLENNGKKSRYTSYLTKDGKTFFPTGIKIDNLTPSPISTPAPTK